MGSPKRDIRPMTRGGISSDGRRFRVLKALILRMRKPELRIRTPPLREIYAMSPGVSQGAIRWAGTREVIPSRIALVNSRF